MRKLLAGLLSITLMLLSSHLRADVTVTNNTPDAFQAALDTVTGDGGGTITVTSPILIGTTNGSDTQTFDGMSNVVVTGGATSSLFIVQNGSSLELDNMTLENGSATNGGAIYVTADSLFTASNCLFFSNIARGSNGIPASTNGTDGLFQGGNGRSGTSGDSAFGGAIFNLGTATIAYCRFVTNSAIGGDGGAGSDGGNGGSRGGNGGRGGSGGNAGGAAIYNGGSITVSNSTFSANLVLGGVGAMGGSGGSGGVVTGVPGNGGTGGSASGAGLFNVATNGVNSISASTFSGNTAQGGDSADGGTSSAGTGQPGRPGGSAMGGGINNTAGSTYITNSSFFENVASGGNGGNGGNGGRAGDGGDGGNATGGGIYNAATVWAVNCTFSKGNAVGGTNGAVGSGVAAGRNGKRGVSRGANLASVAKKKTGAFHLENSIIGFVLASNSPAGSGFGTITDEGYNISADKSIKLKQSTSKTRTNPLIGDLAQNGGPTETMALLNNSPAIDQIPFDLAPPVDQREEPRPEPPGGLSDIGSFELDTNSVRIVPPGLTNTTVIIGSNVTLSVTAQGTPPLVFQWFFNGSTNLLTNIFVTNNLTSSFLTITNAQTNNSGTFQVIITNNFNAVTSSVVTLTVLSTSNLPPAVTISPQTLTINQGSNATFTATATGTAPLFFQWAFGGTTSAFTNIVGATNATLTITNAQTTNQGVYQITVTNALNTATNTASLFVNSTNSGGGPPPFPTSLQRLAAPVSGAQVPLLPLAAAQPARSSSPTVNFTFQTQPNTVYVLEFKRSLSDPAWTPIATNTGTGAWLTNEIPETTQPSGFYRVRTQ